MKLTTLRNKISDLKSSEFKKRYLNKIDTFEEMLQLSVQIPVISSKLQVLSPIYAPELI